MATPPPTIRLVDADDLDAAGGARLVPPGWTGRQGFVLPEVPWDLSGRRWICFGEAADHDQASAAVAALARGVGVVLAISLTGDDRRRFEEDLARIGRLVDDDAGAGHELSGEHTALLDGLASGLSVTAAAARANLSRRTANRRLAEVRLHLGVNSNAEALTRWSGGDHSHAQ